MKRHNPTDTIIPGHVTAMGLRESPRKESIRDRTTLSQLPSGMTTSYGGSWATLLVVLITRKACHYGYWFERTRDAYTETGILAMKKWVTQNRTVAYGRIYDINNVYQSHSPL